MNGVTDEVLKLAKLERDLTSSEEKRYFELLFPNYLFMSEDGAKRPPEEVIDKMKRTIAEARGATYRRMVKAHKNKPYVLFKVDGCWEWLRHINKGYGEIHLRDEHSRDYVSVVHRVFYKAIVGPVADDLDLDHLCRNRACCNPEHLEVVTHKENLNRGAGPGGALQTKPYGFQVKKNQNKKKKLAAR